MPARATGECFINVVGDAICGEDSAAKKTPKSSTETAKKINRIKGGTDVRSKYSNTIEGKPVFLNLPPKSVDPQKWEDAKKGSEDEWAKAPDNFADLVKDVPPPPGGYTGPTQPMPPAQPGCGQLRPAPAGKCQGSPTDNFLRGQQCIAKNYAQPSNAAPCSQRYNAHWRMELGPADKGKNAGSVLSQRYGSMIAGGMSMHCEYCPPSQDIQKAMTIDQGPGGVWALQRNVEPGIVPSSSFEFKNFPSGTDRICISLDVFIPQDFMGNKAGYKLGYGIWGGGPGVNSGQGGGTSPVNQNGFVVRNTWNGKTTALYSYHLNRGGSGRWAVQNASKCDSSQCCIYGDSSAAGTVPKGKWVRIEEEVVLNTFNKPDGYARLWIDGRQVGEITNMLIYESTRNMKIKGLLINDMWGGPIWKPDHHGRRIENYWLANYTVYQ